MIALGGRCCFLAEQRLYRATYVSVHRLALAWLHSRFPWHCVWRQSNSAFQILFFHFHDSIGHIGTSLELSSTLALVYTREFHGTVFSGFRAIQIQSACRALRSIPKIILGSRFVFARKILLLSRIGKNYCSFQCLQLLVFLRTIVLANVLFNV